MRNFIGRILKKKPTPTKPVVKPVVKPVDEDKPCQVNPSPEKLGSSCGPGGCK